MMRHAGIVHPWMVRPPHDCSVQCQSHDCHVHKAVCAKYLVQAYNDASHASTGAPDSDDDTLVGLLESDDDDDLLSNADETTP